MRAFPVIPAVRARLAAATRGGAVRPAAALASDNEDALGAARGIVFGLLLVTPFWAALGSSLWLLLG